MATAILDAKAIGAHDDWALNGLTTKPRVTHDSADATYIQGLVVNDKQEFTLGRSNGVADPGVIPSQIGSSTNVVVNVRETTSVAFTSCTITYEFFSGSTDLANTATVVLSGPEPIPVDRQLTFSDISQENMNDLRIRVTVTALAGINPAYNILEMSVSYTYVSRGMRLRRTSRPRLP